MTAPEREALVKELYQASDAIHLVIGPDQGSEDISALFRQAADTIKVLSPAVTVTEGWKPIETAPKDGSEVIGVYFHDENPELIWGPWTMAWRKNEWVPSWDRCAVVDYMSDFGTDYKDLDASPTHWQPLPPPPSTTPQTGSQEWPRIPIEAQKWL